MCRAKLIKAVEETVKANGVIDGYIRLVTTRGSGTLGLNPFVCEGASIFIIADNIQLYPEELYEKGMKIISATTVRNHPLAIPPQIKSLNYLNNILAKIEALDNDVPEAIMYNHEGFVAEASGDNVFIVRGGVIFAPPVEDEFREIFFLRNAFIKFILYRVFRHQEVVVDPVSRLHVHDAEARLVKRDPAMVPAVKHVSVRIRQIETEPTANLQDDEVHVEFAVPLILPVDDLVGPVEGLELGSNGIDLVRESTTNDSLLLTKAR